MQELQANLAAVETERAHLRAQVETLNQLLGQAINPGNGCSGVVDTQRVPELQRELQASTCCCRRLRVTMDALALSNAANQCKAAVCTAQQRLKACRKPVAEGWRSSLGPKVCLNRTEVLDPTHWGAAGGHARLVCCGRTPAVFAVCAALS